MLDLLLCATRGGWIVKIGEFGCYVIVERPRSSVCILGHLLATDSSQTFSRKRGRHLSWQSLENFGLNVRKTHQTHLLVICELL